MNLKHFPAIFLGLGGFGAAPVAADTLIYESFADSDSTLDGNTPGTGLSGTWSATDTSPGGTTLNPTVDDSSSIDFGTLATSGKHVDFTRKTEAHVSIGTTLSDAGLMDHGETLWFSTTVFLPGKLSGTYVAFALGTDPFDAENNPAVTNSGSGIGFKLDRLNLVQATTWSGGATGTNGGQTALANEAANHLIVGRITWGADEFTADTIDLFLPGTDLALPTTVLESHSAVLDQSSFDTLLIGGREKNSTTFASLDEIRIGASYDDVVVAATTGADPRITSFTSVGPDLWELILSGDAETDYEFYSSTTLDFTPGTLVENLTQGDPGDAGTIGGTNNSVLTTDAGGDGKVRVVLTGDPSDFLRAQSAP